jgi:hypothetical protein
MDRCRAAVPTWSTELDTMSYWIDQACPGGDLVD